VVNTKNTTYFNEQEYRLVDLLRTMEVKEAAEKMGITRRRAWDMLYAMRNKIDKAHATVNTANNWKDSGKHPRAAKLLRRQE